MFGFLKKRAAKKYARTLPSYLSRAYGKSDTYTADQIKAAVQKLGLPEKYICFGYAAFLTEKAYLRLVSQLPVPMPRDEALALYEKYFPPFLYSASANPQTSINLTSAGVGANMGGD